MHALMGFLYGHNDVKISRLLKITTLVANKQTRDLQWWNDGCHDPPVEDASKYWRRDIPDRVYSEIVTSKRKSVINWVKPSVEDESEGFRLAAEKLGLDVEDMNKKAASGWMTQLPNDMWSILENTDSWVTESLEEIEKYAAKHDKDLESLVGAIGEGKSISAPIVVILGNGMPYLIAGNIRLMISKVMGINPEVFFFDLASSGQQNEMALFEAGVPDR